MNLKQMETYVIEPALDMVGLFSPAAARLILLTGYVESKYKYVAQLGEGPARSFWQVETSTAMDHYETYLKFRTSLLNRVDALRCRGSISIKEELCWNMAFAVVMARLKYWRSKTPMPNILDLTGQAIFWKETYNTEKGAGSVEQFIEMCRPIQQELV